MPSIFRFLRAVLLMLPVVTLSAGCAGVPSGLIARLVVNPEARILDSRPAELALAMQTEQALNVTPRTAPTLLLALRPRGDSSFAPVDLHLKMVQTDVTWALPLAGTGKKWAVFELGAADQERLAAFQARFRQLKEDGKKGSFSLHMNFDGMLPTTGAPTATRVETWMKTSTTEGFLKMWSGTVAELQDMRKPTP